ASTSKSAMQYLVDKRDNDKWWGLYSWHNGDLVGMSHLEIVGKFNRPTHITPLKQFYSPSKNTDLYLFGDSYTRHLNDSVFAGVRAFHYIDRNHGYNYHLDSSKRNILLIEIAERYLRPYFGKLQMIDQVCDSAIRKTQMSLS